MSKEKLILVVSDRMDDNKKKDRNEHGLIRMSKAARTNMGYDDVVEIYPDTDNTEKRLQGSMMVSIYQAFSADIRRLKNSGMTPEEMRRVGFVTSRTFNKITGSNAKQSKNIWITDDVNDTVIGADPEFLLFDKDGNVMRANNVMGHHGPIGHDGAMAEVRPSPSISPEGLVKNIRSLLSQKNLVKAIEPYDWMAGCYFKDHVRDYPIGGHIHIGNPIKIAKMSMANRMHFFKAFNKIIDELLSLPMIKLDGTDLGKRRRSQCAMATHGPGFGRFGRFRQCDGRLEHRTLSGMWLMHPTLSTMVFGTAKAIIDEVFRHVADKNFDMKYMFPNKLNETQVWSANFKGWDQIPLCSDLGCVTPSKEMIGLLHESAANKITKKYLAGWYSRMRKLTTYKLYAKYIDGLYEILKNSPQTFQDFDKRIQSNWLEDKPFLD